MDRILSEIKARKVSLRYLREATGYSIPHISNCTNSNKNATKRFMKALFHALNDHGAFTTQEVDDLIDKV